MRQTWFWILLLGFVVTLIATPTPKMAATRVADAFDFPVGKPDAVGYYTSRGFLSYHPGEDWNSIDGGNKDIGHPVYSIGNGLVVFARDARRGWGNVVIIRHTYISGGKLNSIDSFYAHLQRITVREGQQATRGLQVGTIGTNRGMYTAHLHFEIRQNLAIGINRSAFRNDLINYYKPSNFILEHRKLLGTGRNALVAINTFTIPNNTFDAPVDEAKLGDFNTPRQVESKSASSRYASRFTSKSSNKKLSKNTQKNHNFRVNRYDDIRSF